MGTISPPHFHNKVIVVTGASAGVGRATALGFARGGARLALLARDEAGLADTKAEIESIGGTAVAFPLDVADSGAVLAAAEACEARLGPIDVWVNNAMATVFAAVADLTPEEVRRVTEVTYLGYVHGTMAALHFMRPRNRGVIVQVGSSLAYRGIPLQSAYCGAKHAIRGFTDSVRTELIHSRSAVKLTTVHLPAVNTPQFDWARTHQAKLPRPVAPVYTPDTAARAIIRAAQHPAREYWLGGMTPVIILANMLLPGVLDRYLAANAIQGQERIEAVPAARADNLFQPAEGIHRKDGSFGGEARDAAMLFEAPRLRVGAFLGACLLAGLGGAIAASRLAKRSRNSA